MNYQKINDSWKFIQTYYRKNSGVWNVITEADFNTYKNQNVSGTELKTTMEVLDFHVEKAL